MHRLLLRSGLWTERDRWGQLAVEAGIEPEHDLAICLDGDAWAPQLAEDSVWAQRLGIRGTPAFVTKHGGVYLGSDTTVLRRLLSEAPHDRLDSGAPSDFGGEAYPYGASPPLVVAREVRRRPRHER